MHPLFFNGARDVRVKPAAWVRLHATSTESVQIACQRCGTEETVPIDVTRRDGSSGTNTRRDAQLILGRFALFHQSCRDRDEGVPAPKFLRRMPLGKHGRMVLVGDRYVRRP